ncbi:MAG: response regulator [Roseovarius sp.]|nr:response regulator [Roseovarius sp.]
MYRLLHVDDDEDILEVALMSLEMSGKFEVRQCSSGQEAIGVASGYDPQVFLLDIMMPEMSGETTLRKLREIAGLEHVPAIFMTARVQPNEIEKYKQFGVLDVIIKPFEAVELSDTIVEILHAHDYSV